MKMSEFFKSIIDTDLCAVVICDLNHKIIYMNPAAVDRYSKSGGASLIGKSILDCHNAGSGSIIKDIVEWFKEDKSNNRVYTFHNVKENKDVYMVALRNDNGELIGYYEKHEYRNAETAKIYDYKK